jgi:hypothetical protein
MRSSIDDHRAFLAAGLPVNVPFEPEEGVSYAWERPWPDWRDGDPAAIREQLEWPVDGVLSTWSEMRNGMTPGAIARPAATKRWRLCG